MDSDTVPSFEKELNFFKGMGFTPETHPDLFRCRYCPKSNYFYTEQEEAPEDVVRMYSGPSLGLGVLEPTKEQEIEFALAIEQVIIPEIHRRGWDIASNRAANGNVLVRIIGCYPNSSERRYYLADKNGSYYHVTVYKAMYQATCAFRAVGEATAPVGS